MPNGQYGVNISGKVYPLYLGNFINHDDKNDLSLKECPFTPEEEALKQISLLPLPAFNDVAMSYAQDEIKNKKAPLKDVFNKQDQPISKEQSEKKLQKIKNIFLQKLIIF